VRVASRRRPTRTAPGAGRPRVNMRTRTARTDHRRDSILGRQGAARSEIAWPRAIASAKDAGGTDPPQRR
jgi:hypothetical protein